MEINILGEHGAFFALGGMEFSHQPECPLEEVPFGSPNYKRGEALAKLDGGHNKFLESIMIWLDIKAPLYFWKQFDTYRVGVTKQSKSTMHTLHKRPIVGSDFECGVYNESLRHLNYLREIGAIEQLWNDLPMGYLQTRRVCMNYKALRNMILQRRNHKLPEWKHFCRHMLENIEHPELLGGDIVGDI